MGSISLKCIVATPLEHALAVLERAILCTQHDSTSTRSRVDEIVQQMSRLFVASTTCDPSKALPHACNATAALPLLAGSSSPRIHALAQMCSGNQVPGTVCALHAQSLCCHMHHALLPRSCSGMTRPDLIMLLERYCLPSLPLSLPPFACMAAAASDNARCTCALLTSTPGSARTLAASAARICADSPCTAHTCASQHEPLASACLNTD